MNESLSSLQVVNISLKNAIMPKEFYWNELKIDCLNEAFAKALPYHTENFELLAPSLPLNSSPLCVALHVKNLSLVEKELKIFKQLLCDCSLTKNRLRRDGKRVTCQHKGLVELRPAFGNIKPNNTFELELTFRYELLGQQEVHFTLASSSFTIKLQIVVTTLEFDPASLLITKRLSPIAINLFPAPQQVLFLYNSFANDIELDLISKSPELTLAERTIVIKRHEHAPLFLTFAPNYVGSFELEIEIVFNGCKSSMKLFAECTERERDLLSSSFQTNSPNYDLNSQLNSFVLRGDNLFIVLPQNGFSSDYSISLLNNSKCCVKFEWDVITAAAGYPCEICVEPKCGFIKQGFLKKFRVLVKSNGSISMQSIPLKCSIFEYIKENFREYSLPDGYFEFTEFGFYEKPRNWSPQCFKYLQSLYVNISIRVISSSEIIKYAMTTENPDHELLMRQCLFMNNKKQKSISEQENEGNLTKPKREMNDDEQHMTEALIGFLFSGSKYEVQQKLLSHATLDDILDEKRAISSEGELIIFRLMNDILFECIVKTSKDHLVVSIDSQLHEN